MILPGSTIGILGGGQLGRMLTMEARRMGYRVAVLDPGEHGPTAQLADRHIRAPLDDVNAALELARGADVVTLEWENASAEVVDAMASLTPVRPGAGVLAAAQHRVVEKETARRLGLDTAEFRAVTTLAELRAAVADLGAPAILKTARGGYDGKGQALIETAGAADEAFAELSRGEQRADLILEKMVSFRMEASVICARSPSGEIAAFPISENSHSGGILDVTSVPAALPPRLLKRATQVGEAMAEGLDVVGLLAVELFITDDDRVLVNEIAPRPHNSGHYSWEACSVSQFEQQLRAVCGLPLETPQLLRPAAMANLLGEHVAGGRLRNTGAALRVPMTALHLYGKGESRPGRKMGHITSLGDDAAQARSRALEARRLLSGE